MINLSWWEQFVIGAAASFLQILSAKVTNQTELAAIQSTQAFLQKLLAGQVSIT